MRVVRVVNPEKTALLLAVLLSGCRLYTLEVPKADYYYINPGKNLQDVGRVAIVELENNSNYPAIAPDVTEALFKAIQKRQIFSLLTVSQHDPRWQSLQFDLDSALNMRNHSKLQISEYTPEQLSAIRKTLNCNGVLTGTITQYRPYPHMAIGLRLTLVDLRDARLLWAVEQVWDTADRTTRARVKDYYQSQIHSQIGRLSEQLVDVSPLRFMDFVAYEVARTMDGCLKNTTRAVLVSQNMGLDELLHPKNPLGSERNE